MLLVSTHAHDGRDRGGDPGDEGLQLCRVVGRLILESLRHLPNHVDGGLPALHVEGLGERPVAGHVGGDGGQGGGALREVVQGVEGQGVLGGHDGVSVFLVRKKEGNSALDWNLELALPAH